MLTILLGETNRSFVNKESLRFACFISMHVASLTIDNVGLEYLNINK